MQFKLGDIVRIRRTAASENPIRIDVMVQGRILALDAANQTAVVKGHETPIPVADLELVPSFDPTGRNERGFPS